MTDFVGLRIVVMGDVDREIGRHGTRCGQRHLVCCIGACPDRDGTGQALKDLCLVGLSGHQYRLNRAGFGRSTDGSEVPMNPDVPGFGTQACVAMDPTCLYQTVRCIDDNLRAIRHQDSQIYPTPIILRTWRNFETRLARPLGRNNQRALFFENLGLQMNSVRPHLLHHGSNLDLARISAGTQTNITERILHPEHARIADRASPTGPLKIVGRNQSGPGHQNSHNKQRSSNYNLHPLQCATNGT